MCCGQDLTPAAPRIVRPARGGTEAALPVKYIGDGSEHYPGLANEDMTVEEWEALPEEVRDMLVERKLFDPGKHTAKKAKAGKQEADNG